MELPAPPAPGRRRDGDGWVDCRCGSRHWGVHGAAGLLLAHEDAVLLQHRAAWSHHGGTWGLPGGARSSTETALAAALREAAEEAGVPPALVRPAGAHIVDHGVWAYTTVLATAIRRFDPVAADAESEDLQWVAAEDVALLPLHPAFASAWAALRPRIGQRLRLVVDAANVVGSCPDGWWRDRLGAASRLRDALAALAREGASGPDLFGTTFGHVWPEVHLVVEGAARGLPAAEEVRVVAAAGDGDTTVVAEVQRLRAAAPADPIVVVTADRGLRARVGDVAEVAGPGGLWRLLDRLAGPGG